MEDTLFEMANVFSVDSGIDVNIYISYKQGKHGARIKVGKGKRFESFDFEVSIEDNPKIVSGSQTVSNKTLNLSGLF
jgi:hypothetical protein